MTSLTLGQVPEPVSAGEFQQVEVPEFGHDEDGQPLVVNVRGLSVYEWDLLMRQAWTFGGAENGSEPNLVLKEDYNEICLVAAMCSYDDDGQLVFGVDRSDANERLRNLPRRYRPALQRIHRQALAMSGRQESAITKDEQATADAEKN